MNYAAAIDAINLHPGAELSQIHIMPAKDFASKLDPQFFEE
jgi:hypothetical protein